MPHLDKKTGDLVIRIVYDGAPEAGKTTNVRTLHETLLLQRRGTLSAPGTTSRRTEFFDWRDFSGGYLEGHRLRCQLVSVPGQASLLRRRRYLLESADAIVLVADAHPSALDENRRTYASLRAVLERIGADVPLGIVLQANKQDLPGALTPHVLAALLEMPEETTAVPARAESGDGVRETFLAAVRLAAERVRALTRLGLLHERDDLEATPEALLAAMVDSESDRIEPVTGENLRPNLPSARSVPSGCVWPSTGRPFLFDALDRSFESSPSPRAWAPSAAFEWRSADAPVALVLHTRRSWCFHELDEARRALLATVRQQLLVADSVPPLRSFFLAESTSESFGGWWIWMLTRDVATLADPLSASASPAQLDELVRSLTHAWNAVARIAHPLDPAWIARTDGTFAYLPVPNIPAHEPARLPEALRALLGDAWPMPEV